MFSKGGNDKYRRLEVRLEERTHGKD